MKNYLLLICCVFLLLGLQPVSAQENDKKFQASVGFQSYYHEYKEPGLMKNEGFFYGVSYSFAYEDTVLLQLNGLLSYGQVDYSSTSTGEADDIDDICAENRVVVGYSIFDDKKTKVTPFVGIAYRFLQDDSNSKLTTTNNIGYLRESNYYYSPIGFRIKVLFDNGWSLTPEFEYDYFWEGRQESYLGYLAGYEDVTNDQEDGYGYRASLTLAKKTAQVGSSVQIFYRYWDIDNSKITVDSFGSAWIEPKNETVEFGFNVSILF